jgi:hypothetical protein
MTDIRRRLQQVVNKELAQNIIPVKTEDGILVGSVLIVSEGSVKHIVRKGVTLYENVSLNAVAVKLANLMARHQNSVAADKIYYLDQEYSKWFIDSQFLLKRHYSALQIKDFDKADMLWARYCESRDRTISAKDSAIRLTLS